MIKLTIFFLTTFISDGPDNFEQKACDYFFENIFSGEYKNYKVVEFQNHTEHQSIGELFINARTGINRLKER